MSRENENRQRHSGRKKQRRKNRRVGILLAVCVCAVILVGGLAAKYISQNKQQAEASSAQFHVTSDYLEEEKVSYQITNWGQGFNIQLYNYEKENLALISDKDISYTVTVEPADQWEANETSGTLKGAGTMQTNTLAIKPKSGAVINQNDKVTVTVKTTAPFAKTLSAEFTVASKAMPDYQLVQSKDDPNQWHLIIGTNDYSDTVTVSWPQNAVCPDTTSAYMNAWKNSGSGSLTVQENTTYDLVFLSSVTGTKFELTSQNGAAVAIGTK